MAIKNKDGSIYCFSKPNPLMISQSLWPKDEKVQFHNKFGRRHLSEDKELVKEPEMVEDVIEKVQEEVKIVETIEKSKASIERDEDVIDVWCLPAQIITKIDPLYGSNYNRLKYGEKFLIEAKVYNAEDLYLQLITKQQLSEHTVIFPLNKDRRWWRVVNNEEHESGFWIVTCQISDYQPNFVDS